MAAGWKVSTVDYALPRTRGCVNLSTPLYQALIGGIYVAGTGGKCGRVIHLTSGEMSSARKRVGTYGNLLKTGKGRLFMFKKPMLKVIDWFIASNKTVL
jgi:hypothetical protein